MAKIPPVMLTHPLAHTTVLVKFTYGFWLRLWLCRKLISLAIWIAGGDLEVTTDDTD